MSRAIPLNFIRGRRKRDGELPRQPKPDWLKVRAPERLVFTWGSPGDPDDTAPVITVDLRDLPGDRTEMLFHLRGVAGRPGDENVYDGWDSAFDLLGEQLATKVR